MNYYDQTLEKINNLIDKNELNNAKKLIEDELNLPYVPREFKTKLEKLIEKLPIEDNNDYLKYEDIIKYLNGDELKQLRAVEELDRYNLRDYLEIINSYLKNDKAYINAKVLLIESLIKQEINEEINYISNGVEYTFIPKYIRLPEESYGFIEALEILKEYYLKEPSKYEMSKQLLYKKCLLALPISYEKEEAKTIACEIYEYIDKAFN